MSNRMLRDWTDSEKIHILSAEAERFFTRLIMKADDYGRYYGNIKLLRANLFPLYEKLKEERVQSWVKECESAELIFCYEVDGKSYLEIKMFDQKLKVRRSKFPPSNEEDRLSLREGYVYIIGTSYKNPVKIGFSVNPWSRLKEITTNHHEKIEILLTIKGDKQLESSIHKALNVARVKNEWFQLNPTIVECLIMFSKGEISREKLLVTLRSLSSLLRSSTEIEREEEIEVEEEHEEEGKPASPLDLGKQIFSPKNKKSEEKAPGPEFSIQYPFGDEFSSLWDQWKEYKRREFKFQYKSPQSEQAAINDLVTLSKGIEQDAEKIIHQSMAKGWKGFFELKTSQNGITNNKQPTGANVNTSSMVSRIMAMPDKA